MVSHVQLVESGRPRFCVEVWPSQDAETIFESVNELTTHLRQCLGRPAPWFVRDAPELPPLKVVLAFEPLRRLGPEAFEFDVSSEGVRLVASTPTAMRHATYYFLEEVFGVRWLWPGDEGTVAPRADDVTVPIGQRRVEPDWKWRRLWLGGAFYQEDDPTLAELKFGPVSPGTLDQLWKWQKRNRLGGLNIADGHRWAQICSPLIYGRSHPEFFALINGQRDADYHDGKHANQPCTSNPQVVTLTVDAIIARFEAQSDLDGFSMAVNDGHGFCQCEECLKLDRAIGAEAQERTDFDRWTNEAGALADKGHSPITDRMFVFVNQVAERVAERFPDKLLLFLVYGPYRTPPRRTSLHANVIAQFCATSWAHTDEAILRQDMAVLDGLRSFTSRRGIYDYFVNGQAGSGPRGFARVFERSLRAYYDGGCRYFATQAGLDFATGGLAYFVASRLLWDMSRTFEEAFEDYCRSGFGPAADAIRRYLEAYLERWETYESESGPKPRLAERAAAALYPLPWMDARGCELDEARRAAEQDPAILARIEFLAVGLDYARRLGDVGRAAGKLIDRGADLESPQSHVRLGELNVGDIQRDLLDEALVSVDALDQWVTAHADGFWIAAMWHRYQQNGSRGRIRRGLRILVDKFQGPPAKA